MCMWRQKQQSYLGLSLDGTLKQRGPGARQRARGRVPGGELHGGAAAGAGGRAGGGDAARRRRAGAGGGGVRGAV